MTKYIQSSVPLKALCTSLLAGFLLAGASAAFAGPSDSEVLASLVENGMDKAVTGIADTGKKLATMSLEYCQQKDAASLEKARQAWKDAYLAWSWAEPFRAGPIKKLQLYKRIGLWRSNDIIFEGVTTSAEFSSTLKLPEVRGYAGAEYVLFGSKDPGADLACGHLMDVTAEIAELTGQAKQIWDKDREGYVNAGDGMPFMMESEAMSPVVAEILNTTESLLRDRIGLPSNFFTGQAKPDGLQAWHSGLTGEGLAATLNGLKTALDGGAPNSLLGLLATKDGLVNKKDPKLAKAIRKDLAKSEKALKKLTGKGKSIYDQLVKSSSTMKKLYKQLDKLEKDLRNLALGLELDVKEGLEAQFIRQLNKE